MKFVYCWYKVAYLSIAKTNVATLVDASWLFFYLFFDKIVSFWDKLCLFLTLSTQQTDLCTLVDASSWLESVICLMALSTSLCPGRAFTQLLSALDTALATWLSRAWFSEFSGSFMARFVSSSRCVDFSMTSRALSMTWRLTSMSSEVEATPRVASVSTRRALAVSLAATPT